MISDNIMINEIKPNEITSKKDFTYNKSIIKESIDQKNNLIENTLTNSSNGILQQKNISKIEELKSSDIQMNNSNVSLIAKAKVKLYNLSIKLTRLFS